MGGETIKYSYTQDFFTYHMPLWESVLLPQAYGERESHLLEIGSFEGRSAVWMLENLVEHPLSSLTCVDSWEFGGEELFDYNTRVSDKYLRLHKHRGRSADVLPTLERGKFDLAYIDGSHDARDCITDWVLTYPLVKPGGLIILDDYGGNYTAPQEFASPVHVSPKPAIDLILDAWSDQLELVHKVYQVIVRRR